MSIIVEVELEILEETPRPQVAEEQMPETEQIVAAVNSAMTLAATSLRERLAVAQITVAVHLRLSEAASPGTIVSSLPAELWIDAAKRKR